jgi:hypothetical protein
MIRHEDARDNGKLKIARVLKKLHHYIRCERGLRKQPRAECRAGRKEVALEADVEDTVESSWTVCDHGRWSCKRQP